MSFYKIYPEHRGALGSGDAAILYAYIEYRINLAGGKVCTRKDREIASDLHMTESEVRTVRKHLHGLGVIEIERKGSPPVIYYSLNKERFNELVANPERKERKKRTEFPAKVKGKFVASNVCKSPNQPLKDTHVNVNKLHTLTSENYAEPPIYSIDNTVDIFIDMEKNEKSNSRFSDFEIIQPEEIQPPRIPVFEMSPTDREDLLKDLIVTVHDSEMVAWLFGMDRIGEFEQTLFMRMTDPDKKLFSERIAKYVLFAGEVKFRGTLAGYISKRKYLQDPVDYRPKPKLTKTEENWQKHLEGMAETYKKIDQLKQNGNS